MFLGSPRGGDRHLVRVSDSGYFSIPRTQRTDLCSRYVIFIVYCLLVTAYAETMRSVKQERSTSQFSQGCCSVSSRPSEFVPPRKPYKTGLHENTSPFSAFLELRNSQCKSCK